jgi:hypothetical protein
VALLAAVLVTAAQWLSGDTLKPLDGFWVVLPVVLAAVAITGVQRRWHPAIRVGLYLIWGIGVLWSAILVGGIQ